MAQATLNRIQIPSSIKELPRHPNDGFDRFVQAVGNGHLKPGATLTQAQLCDFLDISLSPLRETLVLLEEYGLIEVKQRAGITIINPELSFVRENYQFRILIETEALKAFIMDIPDGWMEAVRARHEVVMADIASSKSSPTAIEAFVALDQFVHSSFVEALNNKSILSTHNRLQQNIRMVRVQRTTPMVSENLLGAGREHLELLDRISEGDADAASACLRRHFESSIYRTVVTP